MSTRSGAAIVSREEMAENLPLDEYATVFQAEIVAILRRVQLALVGKGIGRRIRLCSNSQAAIRVLEALICTSQLIWDRKDALVRSKEVILT